MSSSLAELLLLPNLESIFLYVELLGIEDQPQVDRQSLIDWIFHSTLTESQAMKQKSPRSLSICTSSSEASYTDTVIFSFYTSPVPSRHTPSKWRSDATVAILLTSETDPSRAVLYESIRTVFATVPLSQLNCIQAEFEEDFRLPIELIIDFLDDLSSLTHLIVNGMAAYVSFFYALVRRTGPERHAGVFFMSLRTISLLNIGIGEWDQTCFTKLVDRRSAACRSAKRRYGADFGVEHWLLASLMMRKSAAETVGIEKITVEWDPVHEDLRKLVENIEVTV
ncbi:hypothetical protein V5O48_016902 [Marasmius crinis-equi]|uniref:Uncharacterized protein n=1 Tax=Marasmius crinis-equi TaxID=585013 RepID=A0ABR3EQH5_9AGAR